MEVLFEVQLLGVLLSLVGYGYSTLRNRHNRL